MSDRLGLLCPQHLLSSKNIVAFASLASTLSPVSVGCYGLFERDAFNRLSRPQKNSIRRNVVASSESPKKMAATSNFCNKKVQHRRLRRQDVTDCELIFSGGGRPG